MAKAVDEMLNKLKPAAPVEEAVDMGSEGKRAAAKSLLKAIKSGDEAAVADAVCSIIDLHSPSADYEE